MPKVKYTKEKGRFQESGSSEQMAIFGSAGSITAAGSNKDDATAVGSIVALITTSANNNKGVRLPAGVAGAVHVLVNLSGAQSLKVYPAEGEQIEAGGSNTPKVLATNGIIICIYTGATRGWQRITSA